MLLINVSNHPSSKWSKEKLTWFNDRKIIDIPSPNIDPAECKASVVETALLFVQQIISLVIESGDENFYKHVVLVQGEITFTFALVRLLKKHNFYCVAEITEDGKFKRFREY